MSNKKTRDVQEPVDALSVEQDTGAGASSQLEEQMPEEIYVPPVGPNAQVFRDKVFTARTLFSPTGRLVVVQQGKVAVDDADVIAFLAGHPDFEPLME